MDPRDDDIEFDFFDDEPATTEAQPGQRVKMPRPPGRKRRGPAGPPNGMTPMLRLLGLVVVVIGLVLVFALAIQSCAGSSKSSSYASYMARVTQIAAQSTSNGKQVASALTTPGLKVTDIENKLRGIANAEKQNVAAAESLDPPGRLRTENEHLVEALQFRVSGVNGLAQTFAETASSKDNTNDAALLAEQGDRLVASDVVWDDLFKAPAISQMTADGVTGVRVPESQFVSDDLVTASAMALVLERIRGASTGGTCSGLHGTNIVSVTAMPGNEVLSTSNLNTVTATTDLEFQVAVYDGGDYQEVQLPVTLTIEKSGGAIVKNMKIQLINPSTTQVVTFSDFASPPFATQTTLKVDVKPVPCEQTTSNNSAQYPVIFSLPG